MGAACSCMSKTTSSKSTDKYDSANKNKTIISNSGGVLVGGGGLA
jgi:hypothetical protein